MSGGLRTATQTKIRKTTLWLEKKNPASCISLVIMPSLEHVAQATILKSWQIVKVVFFFIAYILSKLFFGPKCILNILYNFYSLYYLWNQKEHYNVNPKTEFSISSFDTKITRFFLESMSFRLAKESL